MSLKSIGCLLIVISIYPYSAGIQNQNRYENHISGKVTAITDGDTFKLLDSDSTLHRIRVANIDCPEKKQPFTKRAKQFTSNAVFNKMVNIEVLNKDRYGRLIAHVYYNTNKNLANELLKNGLAWHFVKYSKDQQLQALEDEARRKKVGLWADPDAVAPWLWRSHKKTKKQ